MPSFIDLKKRYANSNGLVKTLGQIRREQSNTIMEATWNGDPQNCVAYLYDFFHDSEPERNYGLSPDTDPLKTAVPIKFIVHAHNSDGKDQVSYHIQFKPSYSCNVPYYEPDFHKRYGANFPIGLYIDIPDGHGIYRRWLIVEDSSRYDLAFNKYSVYPTNYYLNYVEDSGDTRTLRAMWCVERLRSSYNAGTYTDKVFTRVENQTVIWLPMNPISEKLTYDQRLIVSAPINCPLTWRITKVENTIPLGINRLSLYQDSFDSNRDYVNLETGEMYADYYSSSVLPSRPSGPSGQPYGEIIVSTDNIRIGGGDKTIQVQWYSADGQASSDCQAYAQDWHFAINGQPADHLLSVTPVLSGSNEAVPNVIRLCFLGNYAYLTKLLHVSVSVNGITASKDLEILSL